MLNNMHNSNYIKLFFCIFVASLMLGCSSVKIQKQVIGKEVNTINNWSIYHIPNESQDTSNQKSIKQLKPLKDNISRNEEFVQKIQCDLISKHRVRFHDNILTTGKICIYIGTAKEMEFPDTKYNVHHNSPQQQGNRIIPVQPTVLIDKEAPVNRIKTKVKVTYVNVTIYNMNDQPIGDIIVSGTDIKPNKISKIIHKLIISKFKK